MKIKCIKHRRKPFNARYTKHQVHLGINHATSVLISTLVDKIFAFFLKKDRGILDYSKMQSIPKMFCVFLTVLLVGLQSVTFPVILTF